MWGGEWGFFLKSELTVFGHNGNLKFELYLYFWAIYNNKVIEK